MKIQSVIRQNPLLRWFCQAQRIPLLFSVTIVAGIFYHYAPQLTALWIVLSLAIQSALFRLFDFVKKKPLLGGVIYVLVGIVFLAAAGAFIRLGYDAAIFAPDDPNHQLDFMVWFLTPQSVLTDDFIGYTIALFLLFTMFIATSAYYFTLVRYRVLMSFVVMVFPFAIYAKEGETMPVLSIIILLVCYFAVMIYCRQAHAESNEVVQKYAPDVKSSLRMPSKKSAYAKVKPEILDGGFFEALGMFIAAATILILVIPKPEVTADRTLFDQMLDMSALSDFLENAIRGFTDSSDGGTYNPMSYNRALYYGKANEPMNLRSATFRDYQYGKDSWFASEYDKMPDSGEQSFTERDGFATLATTADPAMLVTSVQKLAAADPDFAERWHLQALARISQEDVQQYYLPLELQSATYNYFVYPAPLYPESVGIYNYYGDRVKAFQTKTGVLFRYQQSRVFQESYHMTYCSERFENSPEAQALMRSANGENWILLLADAMAAVYQDEAGSLSDKDALYTVFYAAYRDAFQAQLYAESVVSETPDDVRALALKLTEGLTNDYEKALAISDYLRRDGGFVYSLDFPITDADNVETFLFQNKTGVCYQFASAMVELGRAAGLNMRYVEGYAMSEADTRLLGGSEWDFVITTEHAHAFADVFIPGYGWMQIDATAASTEDQTRRKPTVLLTLQYSGLMLGGAAVIILAAMFWIVPMLLEKRFRKKFRQQRDAQSVQDAFARLRKQWKADPADTARVLCEKQADFLQTDLSELLAGFEQTVYGNRCDTETADRFYHAYCAAYDAYKPAVRRQRKAEKAARRAARKVRAESV